MYFYLVLEIIAHIHHQKVIALVNELLVDRIIYRIPVNSVFNEEHCKSVDAETSQQPLVFFVLTFDLLFEQYEVSLVNLARVNVTSTRPLNSS